jgi:hypothetical protein
MRARPLLVLVALGLGCSQETDPNAGLVKDSAVTPPGDSGTDAGDDGCGKLATALCARLGECAPSLLASRFGGAGSCPSRVANGCRDALTAPGTGERLDRLEACAPDVARLVCVELLARNLTVWLDHPWSGLCGSTPKGTVDLAGNCAEDAQCAAGWCKPKTDSKCGACTDFVGEGTACKGDFDCGPRLLCSTGGTCVPVGIINSSCDPTHPCAMDLACVSKLCIETVPKEGATCDPSTKPCDSARGLTCTGTSCTTVTPKDPLADSAPCLAGGACTSPARCYAGTCKLLPAGGC